MKKKNICLISFSYKFLFDVALELDQKYNIKYYVGLEEQKKKVLSTFKDVIFHSIYDCVNGKLPQINYNQSEPISIKLANKMLKYESYFMMASGRFGYNGSNPYKIKTIYDNLLEFYFNFLKKNSIDLVIFPNVPHMGYDLVIYGLCKTLKIKTLIFDYNVIDDTCITYSDFQKFKKMPENYLKNITKKDLLKLLGTRISKYYKINYYSNYIQKLNRSSINSNNKGLFKFIINTFNYLKTWNNYNNIKTIIHLFKRIFFSTRSSAFFFNKKRNIPGLYLLFNMLIYKNFHLKKIIKTYDKLSINPNIKENYIYFGMHLQPESPSIPLGDIYGNQYIALKTLSESISNEIKIYVKEHPAQFNYQVLQSKYYRDYDFYKKISNLKNVKLIKIDSNNQELIKNAIATSTLTGTIGWESLIIGKPVITFGYAWYNPHPDCYYVNSKKECEKALKKILSKNYVNEIDNLRFLNFIKPRLIQTHNSDSFNKKASQAKKNNFKKNFISVIDNSF